MMSKILISKIQYATFANYSPRGSSELSKKSRDICYKFKNGNVGIINSLIKEIQQILTASTLFSDFFGPSVTLVPAPRSSLLFAGGLWPSKMIADGLLEAGLVKNVMPYLERSYAVPKSASAPQGQRTTVQTHYESFRIVNSELFRPEHITIVDDVLTKGNTAFACALRLHELFPESAIRVFAPMRTQGLILDILKIKDPSLGEIRYNGSDVLRDP